MVFKMPHSKGEESPIITFNEIIATKETSIACFVAVPPELTVDDSTLT
jgi:hypothetical protein